jgi:hypothetical protein
VAAHAEEVCVDPGSDPGRDEYGLPPADIEVPDDARDLDRDVQAYYRELRARRRHMRVRRMAGPLTRHGMVLPLVSACLALTLLTGTLLTVLAGHQVLPRLGRAPSGTAQRAPSAAARGQQLPDAQVLLDGRNVGLRSLAPAVLAWVPAGCTACSAVLRQLASRTARAGLPIYFVGTDRAVQDLKLLVQQAGPAYRHHVVNDPTDALALAYGPVRVTAILAHRDYSVDVVRQLPSPSALQQFTTGLHALAASNEGSPAGSAAPAETPAAPAGTPVPHRAR